MREQPKFTARRASSRCEKFSPQCHEPLAREAWPHQKAHEVLHFACSSIFHLRHVANATKVRMGVGKGEKM
ncbi:hypothetical protein TIFTF001_012457 [Ficus carica]|uniref:Uncharacterized protein n=1 Tax=Ficus carica TaxID=3494 RepID=A0AA88A0C5_FICCA|nr:hypothetical protein TIFTF001_012457 [Ficus carica]